VAKLYFKFRAINFTQGENNMTTEPTVPDNILPTVPEAESATTSIPKERALTEYDPAMRALVEKEMPNASEDVQKETMALIEAIKRRAQSEAKGAGELTLDTYLAAVRQVREAVEQNKIFDPERIEYSFKLLQMDAEKNWESIFKEVSSLGDRLADAAKAAWDALTAPRPDSKL
jgi:hypothetical protein